MPLPNVVPSKLDDPRLSVARIGGEIAELELWLKLRIWNEAMSNVFS